MSAGATTLRQRILRAGGWTLAGYVVALAIRLGGSLVMTRLLVPEMFGVMAIASIVLTMLTMMSDLGVHHNIVQSRRGEEPEFLDTAWVVQIVRGVLLWVVAVLLSLVLYFCNLAGWFPPDSVYSSPVLPMVIAVGTFSSVIYGFQSTGVALAHRDLDQKRLIQIELMGQTIAFVLMVAIGLATRSIWALVSGGLVGATVSTVLSHVWLARHRDRFRWEKDALNELLTFGKWSVVSSVFTVLSLNGDRLLLGGYLNADMLGLYAIAMLILGAIEGALGKLLSAVSLPALSEIARTDPDRLREIYYKLRVPGDLILLFAGGVLFAAGQVVIDLLYDPRYAAAGGMLQILALSYFAARYNVAYHVYLAVGKPRYLAIINIVRCVALFSVVPLLFAVAGTTAAIWGIALHGLAMVPVLVWFNARLGINNFKWETFVIVAMPFGMTCGYAIKFLMGSS